MRKPFLAAAAALAVAATGVVVVTQPSAAALSDVPKDCRVSTTAYRADGQRLTYTYNGGLVGTSAYAGDELRWVPSAQQQIGASGDDESFRSTEFAVHPTDGYLYRVSRRGELVDGAWRVPEVTVTRLKAGFGSTRILAYGYPYLYRVTGSALYRYTVDPSTGVPSAAVRLATTGWGTVNSLVYERTAGTGAGALDVLIGTDTGGQLKEWKINRATPTQITAKVLRATGWSPFTSLSTGFCADHPAGRPLLAITATGKASVHFDANMNDGLGTDIKGGSLGDLGWTARAYGQ
ncbi:hypothetical protein E1263_36715 [Kribbella antibiotica]|uniref:Uncharacterized protein n=1 Tax=Kribbella antibiotica TaxID=190195 RepID=A0A4V2YLN8_9ACTN|nr:hypothetical protein [Kribbella antibiotica]TDD46397.1 hypothetical protein E1263_36715 [Kribbella antibiotica]